MLIDQVGNKSIQKRKFNPVQTMEKLVRENEFFYFTSIYKNIIHIGSVIYDVQIIAEKDYFCEYWDEIVLGLKPLVHSSRCMVINFSIKDKDGTASCSVKFPYNTIDIQNRKIVGSVENGVDDFDMILKEISIVRCLGIKDEMYFVEGLPLKDSMPFVFGTTLYPYVISMGITQEDLQLVNYLFLEMGHNGYVSLEKYLSNKKLQNAIDLVLRDSECRLMYTPGKGLFLIGLYSPIGVDESNSKLYSVKFPKTFLSDLNSIRCENSLLLNEDYNKANYVLEKPAHGGLMYRLCD